MRAVMYVGARMITEGHFTETLLNMITAASQSQTERSFFKRKLLFSVHTY